MEDDVPNTATDPVYVMRSYIIDMEDYPLAEQAGRFCEALREVCGGDYSPFDGMKFTYYGDPPYEETFIWDLGELRAKLTFLGDPDDSTWSVTTPKRRTRGAIGVERSTSCRDFIAAIVSFRNR